MEIIDNLNNLTNNIMNGISNLVNSQNDFLKSTIKNIANSAVDYGLKKILPDFIEDEVIEIKDSFVEGGFENGVNTAIEKSISLGKNVMGILNGNFENIDQVEDTLEEGGLIDGISGVIDFITNKLEKNNIISPDVCDLVKDGKNIILNIIEENLEKEFLSERTSLEKIEKCIENWQQNYEQKNLAGLNKSYNKLKNELKNVMPLEGIINNVKKIENINELIKNNSDFNFDKVYLELAENL